MNLFKLPDLGEGLVEAEIVDWHVGAGDHVVTGQPLLSVETEKAVVEIPSPIAATVAELHAAVGDMVAVGDALLGFSEVADADAGAVVGDLPVASSAPERDSKAGESDKTRIRAMPAARALAANLGIDLAGVTPTGPEATITVADVKNSASGEGFGEVLRGVRRSMAVNMTRAGESIVPATVTDVAEIAAWSESSNIMPHLVQAMAAACASEPALNAWYYPQQSRRLVHDRVDLGVAVDTEDGLFVPVLRDVTANSFEQIAAEVTALKSAVRQRSISAEQMRAPTITLSNFGVLGGRHASMVVVPPQVAIFGTGQAYRAVVPGVDGVRVTTLLPLSLTFDHRVVRGGEAARFMAKFKNTLEQD